MLISNVHKCIIVVNSIDTRFSRNVFEAVQKTRSTCFVGSKTTRLRLVVLNPNETLLRLFSTLHIKNLRCFVHNCAQVIFLISLLARYIKHFRKPIKPFLIIGYFWLLFCWWLFVCNKQFFSFSFFGENSYSCEQMAINTIM